MKRIAVILAAACALALPAGALAQSAGDNQYSDPLASPNSGSGSSGGGNSGSSGSSTPAPSQGSSSGSSGAAGASSSGAAPSSGAAASSQSLPRTGGHPELIAVAGLVLLAGGLGLRRAGRRAEEPVDFESVFLRFG